MSDNRPMVYPEGDRYVYRASSLGRADRCLLAARNGYTSLPVPEYLEKAANEGNRYEPIVKERLRNIGFTLGQEQRMVEIYIGDIAIIRGHLDAGYIMPPDAQSTSWVIDPDVPPILEVKSMSKRMFAKWKDKGFAAFPGYAAQLTAYMHGTGRETAVYAVINRDTEELDITTLEEPPMDFAELEAKVVRIEAYASIGSAPGCDDDSGYFCPYDYQCDKRELLFEEIDSGTEVVLIRLANDYDEARLMEKEVRAQKKDAYDELLIALGERERVLAGTWKIAYTPSKRTTLDKEALTAYLKEQGTSLSDFETTTEYRRLDVR